MCAGLARIEEDECADRAGRSTHGRDGRNGAGNVRNVGECDETSVRRDDGERLQVNATVRRQVEPGQLGSRARTQLLPRDNVRVMLGAGADDAVARSHAQGGSNADSAPPMPCEA